MFWSYVVVGIGQMLVCLVFGEVVSQFPISGGLYPWARRLVGKPWPVSEIVIIGEDGEKCPPGVPGTVYLRSDLTDFVYKGDPAKTVAGEVHRISDASKHAPRPRDGHHPRAQAFAGDEALYGPHEI